VAQPEPDKTDAAEDDKAGEVQLRFATFDDIADELYRRTTSFVLTYRGSAECQKDCIDDVSPPVHFNGAHSDLIGLLILARHAIKEELG
jgi:hypothetical protein